MSTQGGAGSWGEVWQYLGFAPTVQETKTIAFFFLLESHGLIFFLMYLSFYQQHASKHLCPPQPVCYPDGELKFLRDLLLLLLGFPHPAVCFLHPNKCMGPALGRKQGMLPSGLYQPCFALQELQKSLVSPNPEYNN